MAVISHTINIYKYCRKRAHTEAETEAGERCCRVRVTYTHTQTHACCMLQMRETRRRHADFSKLSITHAMSERSRQSSIRSRQDKEWGKRQRQRQQRVKEREREMKRREQGK